MRHRRPTASKDLSREKGAWKKNWKGRLPVGLVFPNSYGVGMSNLGFQLVYEMVNQQSDLVCERIFLPDGDGQPVSIESSRPLSDFPVILCSVSFEQDIPGLVKMLVGGGVEPLAVNRLEALIGPGNPLIVGGGVSCFINPEPVAPFMDLVVIGEAEPVLPEILKRAYSAIEGGVDRRELLYQLAVELPGCYVPGFYHFEYGSENILENIKAEPGVPERVRRLGAEAPEVAGHSGLLSPAAEFADLYMVELGRGCSKGCRFCAAGFVYRPPRLWSSSAIVAAIEERPVGVDKVGLLGMEMIRSYELQKVAERLLMDGCRLSFSSLRADVIGDSLLALLAESGLKTVAIAPDGGSERLRRVINKGIRREDILSGAQKLVMAGIVNLKLYFMIGLPTEEADDLDEMVELVGEIREIMDVPGRARGRLSTLTLSINPFVPKAWTPFQYHPFAGVASLKRRLKYLRKSLRGMANVKIMGENPNNAYLQSVLARGDRRLAPALIKLARVGGNWRQVLRKHGINPEEIAMRARKRDELLPWHVIDHGLKGDYLWAEYHRALSEKTTGPCDISKCRRCGVCNR